jgi:hypothetical protein
MLALKVDQLIKKINTPQAIQDIDARMTCEHCGNVGHIRSCCPDAQIEEVNFTNNNNTGFRQRQNFGWESKPNLPFDKDLGNSGFSQNDPSIKDIVLGQSLINESICQKFISANKVLESIDSRMESFNTALQNQLSHNKMLETHIAQLAASIKPPAGTFLAQPEVRSTENVSAVTTRGGKSTKAPPYPSGAEKTKEPEPESEGEEEETEVEKEGASEVPKKAPHEFYDAAVLPFPRRQRKTSVDEQFGKFVEVIRKLYVNIPLLDAMQVPTYAKYLKDILHNKRPIPTTEVVQMTEECSAAILNQLPEKKCDPGHPTIPCSIGHQHFSHALCDLGASVSVMPKEVYDKLNFHALTPTGLRLQLADQTVRYPTGIAEDVPVKIRDFLVPVDFVVLDMEADAKVSIILGRPFLSTANARIDVGAGTIHLHINGKEETFAFKPRTEQCKMIHSFNEQVLNKAHVEAMVSLKSSPPKASPFVFTTKEKVMASVKPSPPPRREMNKSARTGKRLSPREERQNFSGDQERLHQPWTLLRPREAFSSKWNDRSTSRSGHKTGILVGRQPIVILALYFPHLFLSKNELD